MKAVVWQCFLENRVFQLYSIVLKGTTPLSPLQATPEPWLVLRSGACNGGSWGRCCSRWGPPHPPQSARAEHQLGDFSTEPLPCRDPSGSKIKQEGKKARRNSSILSPRGRRPAGGLYTLLNFTPASALPDRADG